MLKYNSRKALKKELAILKCCIATKAIELADKAALGLKPECLINELNLLQAYYDALECHYPYDCALLDNTDYIFTDEQLDLLTDWDTENNTIAFWFDGTFDFDIINIPRDQFLQEVVDLININSGTLGFTAVLYSDNTIRITGQEIIRFMDFYKGAENIHIDPVLAADHCGGIKYTPANDVNPERYEVIDNCLTDEKAEKILRHAMSFCDCCRDINLNNEDFN